MSQRQVQPKLSREEIRAVYVQGEEAVIALVEGLLERIEHLEARVKELENQISKNSRNSSKPPSGDGFGKRTRSLRGKSERPSGGQAGHLGTTLEWSDEVDWVERHPCIFRGRQPVTPSVNKTPLGSLGACIFKKRMATQFHPGA